MPPIYVRPETVLKRSEELLALGTPQSQQQGLESLMEVFQSKRFKSTPLPVLEPIILKFLELCTTLRKPRLARDGLGLYKVASQQVSIPSLELVINRFIKGAEDKLKQAQEEAATILGTSKTEINGDDEGAAAREKAAAGEEDDLELPLQPYTLLMDALVNETTAEGDAEALKKTTVVSQADKDRVERAIVTPWMRFCWEAYKSCLDVAKSNARLEVIYQNLALQAFKFCKLHSRKSEFRRLCEQLRKDLLTAQKYSQQLHAINFSDVDTLTRHLETRFAQLETAVELELWQEAFRSVEDIHGLLVNPAAKKAIKPAMMANYYEKLTRIFKADGGSGNPMMAIFHAAAWGRYLQFAENVTEVKGKKEPVPVAINEKVPGSVLLSALVVPVGDREVGDSKNGQRLVALLNLPKMPSRASLLKDATNKGILRRVAPELQQLYKLIEGNFHPLKACQALAPLIKTLHEDAEYSGYITSLKEVVLSRLFKSLSKVYSAITIDHVLDLVKPFDNGPWATNEKELEKFLMAASKRAELSVSIDHVTKAISFQQEAADKPAPLCEITNLQDSASQQSQLARLALALQNTIYYLDPSLAVAAQERNAALYAQAQAQAEEEKKAIQHRHAIVARRRQKMEEINTRREREEASLKAEKARAAAEEAAKREAELFKERERDRVRKEIEAIRAEEAKKLADTLKARGGLKVDVEAMEVLDTEKLLQLQSKQIEKEQKEIAERLRIIGKRVDHLERAFRKEERPLILQDYEHQKAEDLAAHVASVKASRELAKSKHALDLDLKKRLGRMLPDYKVARGIVEERRSEEFAAKRAEADAKIRDEKAKLKKQVLAEREKERKRRIAEEERLAKEEKEAEAHRAAEAKAAEDKRAAEEQKEAAAREARAKRDAEREADREKIRQQQLREEEALKRRAEAAGGRGVPASASRSGLDRGSLTPSSSASGERPSLKLAPRTQPAPAAAGPAVPVAASVGVGAAGAPTSTTASAASALRPTAVPAGSWRERLAAKGGEGAGAGLPTSASTPAVGSAPTGAYRPRAAGGSGFIKGERPAGDKPAESPASGGAWRRSGAK